MMHRLSLNTFILLLNNVGTAILAFALTLIITRGMGDVTLGRYATVMAWVYPLTVWVDFGINTLITRDVAQNRPAAIHYLHITHPIRLVLGGSTIMVIWVIAPLLSDDTAVVTALRIGIFLALIDTLFGSYTAAFRAWEIMWPILMLNIGLFALQIVGAIVVVWQNGDVTHLLLAIVIADALQLIATWLLWRYLRQRTESRSTLLTTQQAIRLAWPFAAAGVLSILQMRVIVILLDHYLETEQVGWYAAASRLIEAARMAPNALFVALFPQLAALITNPTRLRQIFRRASWIITGYGVMVGGLALLGAETIVPLVFGDEFTDAGPVLMLLSWSLVPGLMRALLTLRLYAYQRERTVNMLIGMALAVQIVTGMILVPTYELSGAAWTVILGETILMMSMFVATKIGETA